MSPPIHDSPYRDDSSSSHAVPASSSHRSSPTRPAHPARHGHGGPSAGSTSPRHQPHPHAARAQREARNGRPTDSTGSPKKPKSAGGGSPSKRSGRGSRRPRRGSPYAATQQLTSHPTGRVAYAETRRWLLEQHGPVCAYCGDSFNAAKMTLDHVAPRRGQTAYDRRDNLVLACQLCNAAKRDLAPIAFLLAKRSRAAHLLRYGTHLSPMLVELARSLAPAGTEAPEPDDESPYRD